VEDGPVVATPSVFSGTAVALGTLATVIMGIVPEPVLSLAHSAATQLFVR
jgi:NADH-quinone oxidoreductase subunit N